MQLGSQVQIRRRFSKGSFTWHQALEEKLGHTGIVKEINRSKSCPMVKIHFLEDKDTYPCWIHAASLEYGHDDVAGQASVDDRLDALVYACKEKLEALETKKKEPYDEFKDPNELNEYVVKPINFHFTDNTELNFYAKDDHEALRYASLKFSMGRSEVKRLMYGYQPVNPSEKHIGVIKDGQVASEI